MRIRRNILSLSQEEFRRFIAGLEELKKGSKRGAPSRYDEFVQRHYDAARLETPWKDDPAPASHHGIKPVSRTQPHYGPAFLPWHRLFVYEFERSLGEAMKDSSFGLPYWDWSNPATMFKIFDKTEIAYMGGGDLNSYTEVSVGGNKKRRFVTDGPFAHWRQWIFKGKTPADSISWDNDNEPGIERNRVYVKTSITDGIVEDCTKDRIDDLLNKKEYDNKPYFLRKDYMHSSQPEDDSMVPFRPQVEGLYHDSIHKWIGAMTADDNPTWGMGSLASPNDPIFYLHHCNIDRMWAKWQATHKGLYNHYAPTGDGPLGHNLKDDMAGLPKGSRYTRPLHALSYESILHYRYDEVVLQPTTVTTPAGSSAPITHQSTLSQQALANTQKILHTKALINIL